MKQNASSKRSPLFRSGKSLLTVCFITALSFSMAAAAGTGRSLKSPTQAKTEKSRALLKTLIENVHTKENVLHMLAAAGATIESLTVIGKDIGQRIPKDMKLPAMTLLNDEIQVGGKHSGVRVISYDPIKIKIENRTWTYDPDKTSDVSYLDLVHFFATKSKSSAMARILLPEAQAQFFSTMFSGAVSGGVIGALSGSLIGLAVGADPLTSAIAGGGLGMVFGSLVGANNQNAAAQAAPCGRAPNGAPYVCPAYPYQYQYQYAPTYVPPGGLIPPPVR